MNKNGIPSLEEQMPNLKQMSDKDIDFSDIPEISDFTGFERGKFYHPIKKSVTLRLDAYVQDWFKNHHSDYQSAINAALSQYIQDQR